MKSLHLSPADIAAMAKVARDYGVLVEHEFEGTTLRIQPIAHEHGVQRTGLDDLNGLCDRFDPVQSPLNYREMFTLKTLVEIGVGEKAYSSLIRWCDLVTVKKLAARGYILAKPPGRKISDDEIRLTDEGLFAWSASLKPRHDHDAPGFRSEA